MRQFSIRKLMLMIAGLAVAFAIMAWLVRQFEYPRRMEGSLGKCASNMHYVALALVGYCTNNGAFPSGTWPHPSLPPERRLSWYASIMPFLDEQELYNVLEKTEPWDAVLNQKVACTRPPYIRCPMDNGPRFGNPWTTSYIGIAGVGTDAPLLPKSDPRSGVFGYDRQTTLADIKDGLANTMLISESGRANGAWLQGGPATVRGLDPADKPYIGPGRQFGGLHPGCVLIALADGSVRVVDEKIDPKVFEALATMAGGESLPSNW